ncbi:hypothetical protein J2J97_06880 [Rhizobium bangladeshense]|uniref:hypothetical protein n=1 Tax=Rhizobium bangladeshense TaxID=1138189 RepID=UPI001A97EF8D|nr:hypothetical protein [Rhizobium bangladeshense]QSY95645.1 hypothetical protein J2J97_06880 [Rhizobium bangladeshense]
MDKNWLLREEKAVPESVTGFTDPLSLPLEEQKRVSDSRRRFSLRVKPSPITHVAEIAD